MIPFSTKYNNILSRVDQLSVRVGDSRTLQCDDELSVVPVVFLPLPCERSGTTRSVSWCDFQGSFSLLTCTEPSVCFLLVGHLRPCSLLGVTMKSRSLSLSYSCPSDTASPLFPCHIANYSIMFRPNHSGEDFMVRTSFNETFLLDRLIPFTVYEIKVRALYNHSYCNSSSISPSSSTYGMTPPAGEEVA